MKRITTPVICFSWTRIVISSVRPVWVGSVATPPPPGVPEIPMGCWAPAADYEVIGEIRARVQIVELGLPDDGRSDQRGRAARGEYDRQPCSKRDTEVVSWHGTMGR